MRLPRLLSAAIPLAVATTLVIATPANAASDAGLFGSSDPTYDGTFRQSLAILALDAADARIPAPALTWLSAQQCADGSFMSYRASTAQPCAQPDPAQFSGPDSNSTALAALALQAADRDAAADRAVAGLLRTQNSDGGWGYTLGGASDVNSTGLVISVLDEDRRADARALKSANAYLRSVVGPCTDGAAGLPFQAGSAMNDLASAQALAGMTDGLAAEPAERFGRLTRTCSAPLADRVAHFVADRITTGAGLIPSAMDAKTPDVNTTAWAVLGLVGAERGATHVARATRAIAGQAKETVRKNGVVQPAAAAMLALVSEATGGSPRSFGGVDPVALIVDSIRK